MNEQTFEFVPLRRRTIPPLAEAEGLPSPISVILLILSMGIYMHFQVGETSRS